MCTGIKSLVILENALNKILLSSLYVTQVTVNAFEVGNLKSGKNLVRNRLNIPNNKIRLNWLRLSPETYKIIEQRIVP